jgi:hypothetical protein
MSTIATTAVTVPTTTASAATATRRHPVRRAALVSGAAAAVATTAVAAGAHTAGVPLEIEGEMIPLVGFAQMTLLGAVLGGLIAAGLNRFTARARRWFVPVAIVLTILSCLPSVAFPPDTATKVMLVAIHMIAAVVIVPVLARQTRD